MNDTHSGACASTDLDDTLSKIVNMSAADLADDSDASFSLGRLERDLQKLKARWHSIEVDVADRDAQIAALKAEVATGRDRIAELEAQLAKTDGDLSDDAESVASYKSKNAELMEQVEDLQRYIDGRKHSWEDMQAQIRKYEDAVAGMGNSLEANDGVVALLEKEKAALASTVMGLQRELEMVKASRDGGDSDLLQELENAKSDLDEALRKAKEEEIRANELDAVLHESRSERRSLEKELRAQQELVDSLESEVRTKQDKLTALDTSINRLSAIGSELCELDLKTGEHASRELMSETMDKEAEMPEPGDRAGEISDAFELDGEPVALELVDVRPRGRRNVHYPITHHVMTIGRSRKSDIRLKSKYVSRIHARVRVTDDGIFLEDVGSTNGFLVNKKHRRSHELSDGDLVEFGMKRLRFTIVPKDPG